jgi:hypothetical protein
MWPLIIPRRKILAERSYVIMAARKLLGEQGSRESPSKPCGSWEIMAARRKLLGEQGSQKNSPRRSWLLDYYSDQDRAPGRAGLPGESFS